jgi:hypothetical protein
MTDLDALNQRLRRTLPNYDGYHEPLNLVARQIQAR